MSDVAALTASYCPECGEPVASAESIRTDDRIGTVGVFERAGAHAIVGINEIRIYEHAEADS